MEGTPRERMPKFDEAPVIGMPVIATALAAPGPPADTFKRQSAFAAWLGLTPPSSASGKQKLDEISVVRTFRRRLRRDTNIVQNRQRIHAPTLFLASP
jgi:transposase